MRPRKITKTSEMVARVFKDNSPSYGEKDYTLVWNRRSRIQNVDFDENEFTEMLVKYILKGLLSVDVFRVISPMFNSVEAFNAASETYLLSTGQFTNRMINQLMEIKKDLELDLLIKGKNK